MFCFTSTYFTPHFTLCENVTANHLCLSKLRLYSHTQHPPLPHHHHHDNSVPKWFSLSVPTRPCLPDSIYRQGSAFHQHCDPRTSSWQPELMAITHPLRNHNHSPSQLSTVQYSRVPSWSANRLVILRVNQKLSERNNWYGLKAGSNGLKWSIVPLLFGKLVCWEMDVSGRNVCGTVAVMLSIQEFEVGLVSDWQVTRTVILLFPPCSGVFFFFSALSP